MEINREHTTFHTHSIIIGCIKGVFRKRGVKNKFQDKSKAKLIAAGTFFQQKLMKSDKRC